MRIEDQEANSQIGEFCFVLYFFGVHHTHKNVPPQNKNLLNLQTGQTNSHFWEVRQVREVRQGA